MSKRLRAVSLIVTSLPSIAAQPVFQPANSERQTDHDHEDIGGTLLKRSEAEELTGVVVGITVAVGVFILFLLSIAVYLYRRKLLRLASRESQATSPRTQIYREQDRNRTSRSRNARKREKQQTRRSSNEKKRTRSNTPIQPSSTAASVASSFSPAWPKSPTIPEMAQAPPSHAEPSRFRPPVSLPPLLTQPQQLQSIDATVTKAFDPSQVSRWSMSTLGMNLLADTMTAPDPERYSEPSPSSRYPDTTPSAYGPSPILHEASPERHVSFSLAELPGCVGQSTSPWRYDPSPETPEGWSRGASDDDLVSPVVPRHLTSVEIDERQATSPLNTIREELESGALQDLSWIRQRNAEAHSVGGAAISAMNRSGNS